MIDSGVNSHAFNVVAWTADPGAYSIFVNGSDQGQGIEAQALSALDKVGFDMAGEIAEIVAYDRVLPALAREKIEAYLAHKWDLADTVLLAGHPHKAADPFTGLTHVHEVINEGGDPPVVKIFWGLNDGGENSTDVDANGSLPLWDEVILVNGGQLVGLGPVSAPVTNLERDTRYFFRAYAENIGGGVWSPVTKFFTASDSRLTKYTMDGLVLWLDASDVDGDGQPDNLPAVTTPEETCPSLYTGQKLADNDPVKYARIVQALGESKPMSRISKAEKVSPETVSAILKRENKSVDAVQTLTSGLTSYDLELAGSPRSCHFGADFFSILVGRHFVSNVSPNTQGGVRVEKPIPFFLAILVGAFPTHLPTTIKACFYPMFETIHKLRGILNLSILVPICF